MMLCDKKYRRHSTREQCIKGAVERRGEEGGENVVRLSVLQ